FRDLRDMDLETTVSFDLPAQVADVSTLQLRAPWADLSARGRVAWSQYGQSNAHAVITRIETATLMHALRLPVAVATEVDGTVEAEWQGLDYLRAKGVIDATLRRASARATPPIETQRAVPVTGRVIANADGSRIVAHLVKIEAPGAQVDGRVEVNADRQMQGRVTARSADIQGLIALIESMSGE